MAVKITSSMLAAYGRGDSVQAIKNLRNLLAQAGVTEVELHPREIEQIKLWREQSASFLQWADQLEALGPMPAPAKSVDLPPPWPAEG